MRHTFNLSFIITIPSINYFPLILTTFWKMSSNKFTFLFAPVDAVGHFNACIGIAGQLRDRGHNVVFATPIGWKGKLVQLGFTEEVYSIDTESGTKVAAEESENDWGQIVKKMSPALASTSSMENMEKIIFPMFKLAVRQRKLAEADMKRIMNKVKPDVVIMDNTNHSPALLDSGVPWVLLISFNPLGISSKNVPPAVSGYPTNSDPALWNSFNKKRHEIFDGLFQDFKGWVKEQGGSEIPENNFPFFVNFSPHANIYMYPIELDYTMYRPNPPNFHRFDAFVRMTEEKFQFPEQLQNGPGKLVYFSMGTIGCSELGLMRRLIEILAKSPNRFIVSKGPLADQIELPNNMWGAQNLPQTKVIPVVDLVITHGGNNTITESFYFGKRVLVLPLFGDQWDNGQRVQETGLGLQFHPYKVTEQELLSAIELLLGDEMLERRMVSISKRIQSSNSQSCAADVVENVATNNAK